jgi:hypothetical protein
MGEDSIDMVILNVDMGYLVALPSCSRGCDGGLAAAYAPTAAATAATAGWSAGHSSSLSSIHLFLTSTWPPSQEGHFNTQPT